jgi:hypothetical protein
MPALDQERLAAAELVRRELAVENQLSPAQARAYVRCLQSTWEVPVIQWAKRDSARQLVDARRLLQAAHIFRSIEGAASARAIDCYRRTGEILEWLTRADDALRTEIPIELMAAGAYQLGGMPAMANGLLSQMRFDHDGVRLYSAFLQANFDRVLFRAGRFWHQHPELTSSEAEVAILQAMQGELEAGVPASSAAWSFSVELVRSLGLVAHCLRRGDDTRLKVALQKLHALDAVANRTFSDDTALVVSIMRHVADGYAAASIYRPLRALAALRPQRTQRLLTYGRDQFSRGRGILWTSQQQGLDRLLHDSSFALCTPTGSGKTLVANLAVVKELLLNHDDDDLLGPLALYVVPSRALAGEVEAKLTAELGRDITVTGLYGGADWGITDNWLTSFDPVVVIVTVEKADALMRYLGAILLARLKLIIVDEAHQVVPDTDEATKQSFSDHSNRAIRLESLVSRVLAQRPDVVRIALTAVAGGAAGPVAKWIEGRAEAIPVGVRYRSTRQVIGVLQTAPQTPGKVLLDLMNGRPLYLRGREDPVYLNLDIAAMPVIPPAWRNSLNHFNCLNVLWTALHLAEDQRILISVAQEPEKTMRWFKEALERAEWTAVVRFEPPEEGEDLIRFEEAKAACRDYCGEDSFESFLLDRGIATNHGQMPQRLRRLMVEVIDRKICPITVATATLTEGVNLPFDLIFLTSLRRRSWDPVAEAQIISPLSTAEFRNLAGRAGRPGATRGIEGLALVALPTRISTTAEGPRRAQNAQRRQMDEDYERLRASLIIEEQDQAEVSSPIALLLHRIWERAGTLLGMTLPQFLDWLEVTAPVQVSVNAGKGATDDLSRLADAMDELDGTLLTFLEELARSDGAPMTRARAEQQLADLWRRTFTAVASAQEAWLEAAFIRRGVGVVENIYPDVDERSRLYQYGFTPAIGQRFEAAAAAIRAVLAAADDYGEASAEERLAVFEELGELLVQDRGFGFRVRATVGDRQLLANWTDVLAWWLHAPDAGEPDPEDLRSWQRFVSDNLEFRLGVAAGAVVAQVWNETSVGAVPSLAEWKNTTQLPWFAFWIRELLRFGTHDPFVAFCLAQNLARTREEAAGRRAVFDAYVDEEIEDPISEDRIDPQLFLKWQASLPKTEHELAAPSLYQAILTGTQGGRGRYSVIPADKGNRTAWLDPAGFELALSDKAPLGARPDRSDFELITVGGAPSISRVFRP